MVMTLDFHPDRRGSRPAPAGCFYLQIYISPPTTQVIACGPPSCPVLGGFNLFICLFVCWNHTDEAYSS